MKKMILLILIFGFLNGANLEVNHFESDLYSKEGRNIIKKISLSLNIVGRYVDDSEDEIIDALNIIIGSYFVEDILTSKGKEMLKKNLISYVSKKYGVDIDDVFIRKLFIVPNPKTEEIIKALRESGECINKSID